MANDLLRAAYARCRLWNDYARQHRLVYYYEVVDCKVARYAGKQQLFMGYV